MDQLAKDLWALAVDEFVVHGIRHLVWILLGGVLLMFFGRKWRTVNRRLEQLENHAGSQPPAPTINVNVGDILAQKNQKPAHDMGTSERGLMALHSESKDVLHLGTTKGDVSIRLFDKQKTMEDLVRWFHKTKLLAPLQNVDDEEIQPKGKGANQKSPKELVDMIEGLTSIQANPIIQKHLDCNLTISSKVLDVDDKKDAIEVYTRDDDDIAVYFEFAKAKWKESVENLKKGDEIKATGRLASIEEYGITLRKCSLLHQ